MTRDETKPTASKYYAEWLCRNCRAAGTAAAQQQAELAGAITAAHADQSPDCRNPQIATLPHVHPH